MTLYSDYTQIGNDKYYNRDLEARQALNNLGALAAKNQAALATDVSGVLPIANGGTGASNVINARAALELSKTGGRTEFYVSTSGNDTTGDGSQSKPYRTISKAVYECPFTLYNTVYIAPGTYTEHVYIARKVIVLVAASDGEVIIDGETTGAVEVAYNSFVWIGKNLHLKTNSTGSCLNVAFNSSVRFDNRSGAVKLTNPHQSGSLTSVAYGSSLSDQVGTTYPIIINSGGGGFFANGPAICTFEKLSGSVAGTLFNAHPGIFMVSNTFKTDVSYGTEQVCTRGGQVFYN